MPVIEKIVFPPLLYLSIYDDTFILSRNWFILFYALIPCIRYTVLMENGSNINGAILFLIIPSQYVLFSEYKIDEEEKII